MTEFKNPRRGNNTPLSEISLAAAFRLHLIRERFGIDSPTARAICEIAFSALGDGGRYD
ncbi:hypothetical protein PUV54_11315 [Hyphococcus flavus]|uniref:Uncharacterized protein n=1 Tax=Hyphococcus flavus TaxID=1866326 RepID=A0AAE9ZBX5_9PROT|nr:hypothetical protein [Hyphococcus flavus]WDI30545.1 hypothetical protein PUV54_11315 [Hyphococcus flavus]